MEKKKIVLTGTTSGIGYELLKIFAKKNWDIVTINRSKERFDKALERLKAEINNDINVESYIADLSDLDQIRSVCKQIKSAHNKIDALINNAGVLFKDNRKTNSGIDLHFQVNTIAPILVSQLLSSALRSSSARAKIVNVSSNAIFMTHKIDPDKLVEAKKPGIFGSYAQSKLAVSALTSFLAKKLAETNIDLYAIDPGGNRTQMVSGDAAPFFVRWLSFLIPPPSKGASLLSEPIINDTYFAESGSLVSSGKIKELPKGASDKELQERLFSLYQEITD